MFVVGKGLPTSHAVESLEEGYVPTAVAFVVAGVITFEQRIDSKQCVPSPAGQATNALLLCCSVALLLCCSVGV